MDAIRTAVRSWRREDGLPGPKPDGQLEQLEDMIGIAQRQGRELIIVTRQTTTLGSPASKLGKALAAGKLRIVGCLPG